MAQEPFQIGVKQLEELEYKVAKEIGEFWGLTDKDLKSFEPPQIKVESLDSLNITLLQLYDPSLKYSCAFYNRKTDTLTIIEERVRNKDVLEIAIIAEVTHAMREYFRKKGILGYFRRLIKINQPVEELFEAVTVMGLREASKEHYRAFSREHKKMVEEEIQLKEAPRDISGAVVKLGKTFEIIIDELAGGRRRSIRQHKGYAYAERALEYLRLLPPEKRREVFMYSQKKTGKEFMREEFLTA